MRNTIQNPRAPNQPVAPTTYTPTYFNIFTDALRLYFNRIDAMFRALFGSMGGRYIELPYVAASDSGDQLAGGDNTPTKVTWDTLESGNGFTLNVDNTATITYPGVYKIDYSLQVANTANVEHDIYVWLEIDGGVQVANSSSVWHLPARKSAGDPSYVVAYSSVTFEMPAEETVSLWWATDKAYNSTGPVDGVYLKAIAAISSPYDRPANPSAVGSIVFVSNTTA